MSTRWSGSWADPARLGDAFDAVRAELKVPEDFPTDVVAEARAAAGAAVLPARDETAVPFLTVAPAGSGELDQGLHIERAGRGYLVRCAVTDVPDFVRPGRACPVPGRSSA